MTSARSRDALWVRHPFCPHPRDPRRRGTQHREELGGTEHGTGNRETWALAVATHIRALCTLLHSLSATFELDAVDMPVLRMRTLRLERVTAPTFWERVSGRVVAGPQAVLLGPRRTSLLGSGPCASGRLGGWRARLTSLSLFLLSTQEAWLRSAIRRCGWFYP